MHKSGPTAAIGVRAYIRLSVSGLRLGVSSACNSSSYSSSSSASTSRGVVKCGVGFLADMYYGPGSVSEYFESDPNFDPHTNGFWAKELVSAEDNEHTATQSQRQQYRQQPSKASSSAGSSNDGTPRGSVGLMMMQDRTGKRKRDDSVDKRQPKKPKAKQK